MGDDNLANDGRWRYPHENFSPLVEDQRVLPEALALTLGDRPKT